MKKLFWPEISDLWSAKKACGQASAVCSLVAIATGTLAYFASQGKTFFPGITTSNFLDAGAFLILSILIYHCSRIASLAAVALYSIGQVMTFQQSHRVPISGILFTLLLISGVRGAFGYHEMKKGLSREELKATLESQKENSEPPAPSLARKIISWIVLIAILAGGFLFYQKYKKDNPSAKGISDLLPAGKSTAPVTKPKTLQAAKKASSPIPKVALPSIPQKPLPGEKVFKLRDGRSLTGRVIMDDPVYYTIETSGGRQEIVIKEDLAE